MFRKKRKIPSKVQIASIWAWHRIQEAEYLLPRRIPLGDAARCYFLLKANGPRSKTNLPLMTIPSYRHVPDFETFLKVERIIPQ